MTESIDAAPAVPDGAHHGGALSAMRLAELQAIAGEMGLKGTAKMRKSDLVSAIQEVRGGAQALAPSGAESARRAPRRTSSPQHAVTQGAETTPAAAAPSTDAPGAEPPATDAPGSEPARSIEIQLPERRAEANGTSPTDERTARALEAVVSVTAPVRQQGGQQQGGQPAGGQQQGGQPSGGPNRDGESEEGGGRSRRRSRDRYRDRDRKRRTRPAGSPEAGFEDVEVAEDDVLVPVAGILDILDNYAFVRTSGYLPGPNDVYVSLGQVKKYGLRRGDAVTGAVRQGREGEQGNQRQKFNALVRLDTVNGAGVEAMRGRPEFTKLTPLYPQHRLRLESEPQKITPRVIDLVAPIGKGQRGLIVSPPKAGKTIIMQQIANAITRNNPEVHLMVVLVDERPEEVTEMERTVHGEVIASTFDRPASDHTIVAELAIERAKRLVELGRDVVVLLDSITRLGRAYNLAAPASGRILSGGVDASALYPPKKFFGAARNIENGGSLTILASALVETGSKMDEVIFEEFKGTGNMELRLSRSLADKRIFPAVDVNASGTRREEILISPDELKIVWKLRRVMAALDQQQAIELLLGKLKETSSNAEFLLTVQKTTPGGDG